MAERAALWLFGYGSLIWRPAIPFVERAPALALGHERRFYQGSTDHRGVPEAPGRVVTLVPSAAGRCVGVAYRVAEGARDEVLEVLDHRERGGYTRLELDVWISGRATAALTYVARPDNPNWLGPAPAAAIAGQIAASRGPSGANREYLLRLAAALRELGADDAHVFELERAVLALGDA